MNLEVVGILVAILINSAVGQDPTLEVKFKKASIKNFPNPYLGEWSAEIIENGDFFSANVPVIAMFPETTTLRAVADYRGARIIDSEIILCELMENELYGKDLIKHGHPIDIFPQKCPISPGSFSIIKYTLPKDKIPPGTPDGEFDIDVTIGEPGKDPYITAIFETKFSHKLPQVPGLGR